MIACDKQNYKFEWFHYSCIKATQAVKGKWFCRIAWKEEI